MRNFWAELRTQRWDDHRFYHHSRINQSLHLLSAISFIIAYVTDVHRSRGRRFDRLVGRHGEPAVRPLFLRAEGIRRGQSGRRTSTRKTSRWATTCVARSILHVIWAASPALLLAGSVTFRVDDAAYQRTGVRAARRRDMAASSASAHCCSGPCSCFILSDVQTGLVWLTKILTDPVSRRETLLQGAALFAARRADRSHGRTTHRA